MTTQQQQTLREKVRKAKTLREIMEAAEDVYDLDAPMTLAKKIMVNNFYDVFFSGIPEKKLQAKE